MNLAHLTRAHKTVFEHLDDAGLRTACTTYLIYRGRTRHDPSGASVYRRIAEAAQFRHPVYGARELFYADLFDSRDTGCTSALGMPGQRDRHTGCVGAYLVEHDLFDFLLFSLPDNDTYSHKVGPGRPGALDRGGRPRARADHARGRRRRGVPRGARGDRDVGPLADRGRVGRSTSPTCSADMRVLSPSDPAPTEAELAACPVGALGDGLRARRRAPRRAGRGARPTRCSRLDGRRPRGHARGRRGAACAPARASCASRPGDDLADARGRRLERRRATRPCSSSTRAAGGSTSETYPDALGRLWSALACPHSGDVLVSAELGYEFVDWGGADHVGGGSHGSLHRDDSEGVLLLCGVDAPEREQWSLADVTPLVLEHFGVPLAA